MKSDLLNASQTGRFSHGSSQGTQVHLQRRRRGAKEDRNAPLDPDPRDHHCRRRHPCRSERGRIVALKALKPFDFAVEDALDQLYGAGRWFLYWDEDLAGHPIRGTITLAYGRDTLVVG